MTVRSQVIGFFIVEAILASVITLKYLIQDEYVKSKIVLPKSNQCSNF